MRARLGTSVLAAEAAGRCWPAYATDHPITLTATRQSCR